MPVRSDEPNRSYPRLCRPDDAEDAGVPPVRRPIRPGEVPDERDAAENDPGWWPERWDGLA